MAQSTSRYAQMMTRLSRRIFHEPLRPFDHKGTKVANTFGKMPIETSAYITEYYPPHPQINRLMRACRAHGLYRDEHIDFNEEMDRQRALRGKIKKVRPYNPNATDVIFKEKKDPV